MEILSRIITWINIVVNAVAAVLLGWIPLLPGWLSNTIIAAVVGVVLLIIFKYTSNQDAIKSVRDNIKANMLALKLYKESLITTLKSEFRVIKGALLLLVHALRPMAVIIIPMTLLLTQMSQWYQFRPLKPQEETVVTLRFNRNLQRPWPNVRIEPSEAYDVTIGPVKILSKNEVCWDIKALKKGYHNINFQLGERKVSKQLAVGNNLMKVSKKRPDGNWHSILLHPVEKPFGRESKIQAILIDYPKRDFLLSGGDSWIVYFFIASLVFAFILRPFLKVNI